ncbi:MAG: amidohydrolase family protein [Desulfobacter sp.]|nr:amidohydrolase family protein [Desulfobacter sp.]
MTVYQGSILTCDAEDTTCNYLVEEEGKIKFTGNDLPEIYSGHNRVVLGKKALIPSFGDSHLHFSSFALFSATLDVREAKNFSQLSDRVKAYVEKTRAKVILGFGISAHSVEEGRLITKAELDKIEKRPLMLVKYDGHASVINTAMQNLLPKKISTLRGYNADTGQLFQEAFFAATDHITGKISVISLIKNMISGVDTLASKGISLVHPAEGVGFLWDLDVDVVRFLARGLLDPVQFRIFFQTLDIKKVEKRKLPRIGGCFATALDGCFGSCDAALNQPYTHDPANLGILFYDDNEINTFVQTAHDKGLQVQLHAIGDAAVAAFARAQKNNFRKNHRHSIIHACLMSRSTVAGCAEHGIGIAAQPAFIHWDLEPYEYIKKILGDRVDEISPLKTMLDMGVRVSGGSDAPCTQPDPAFGIYCACNHYREDQAITVAQALKMYTSEIAWAGFDENQRGSLEPGKIADMVILDQNPFEMDKKELFRLKTKELILKGRPYKGGQGLASLLWKAILPKK